jgi:hypothetical protein
MDPAGDLTIIIAHYSQTGKDDHIIPFDRKYPYFELFYKDVKISSIE